MSGPHYTYYLQMTDPEMLSAKQLPVDLNVVECEIPQPSFNRFLYEFIGKPWAWNDLDDWSEDDWKALVEQDSHRTWIAYHRGAIAGYYELFRPNQTDTEIRYFGLASSFIGLGFGGALLTHALQSAWDWAGTTRVWVHTCTDDHPGALANYQRRGMQLYDTVQHD